MSFFSLVSDFFQGLLLDALADVIKTEPDCPFQSAKSVNKWIKSVTNNALPALHKLVKSFKENDLNMDEVEVAKRPTIWQLFCSSN